MKLACAVALVLALAASASAIHINKLHHRVAAAAAAAGGPSGAHDPNQPCSVSLNGAAKPGTCWVKATCDKHKGTLLPEAGASTTTGKCPKGQACCVVLPPPAPVAPVTPVTPVTPTPVTPAPVTPTPAPVTPVVPPVVPPVTPPKPASPLDVAPTAGKVPKLQWSSWSECSVPWADASPACRCRLRMGQPGCDTRCDMYGCVTGKANIDEGCMWSIEDEKCVNLGDTHNPGIVAHAKSYTRDQVLAYYREYDRLNPPKPTAAPPQDFQPITNPYAYTGRF